VFAAAAAAGIVVVVAVDGVAVEEEARAYGEGLKSRLKGLAYVLVDP
jgi:hypothetical protein